VCHPPGRVIPGTEWGRSSVFKVNAPGVGTLELCREGILREKREVWLLNQ
jgi:hypothetical protein